MMKQTLVLAALAASASAFAPASRFAAKSALAAEPEWAPPSGEKWEEKNYETEIQKLEAEAEERLDAKIAEMMSKVETVGKN
mmetsp:Transcript_21909/g.60921  ORF Transcript_21909/g.60921 Transcript_21909/m.60921 type:complete len:82 (+) Transcript_21909:82-327(+)|eukprot:CAMPEP_0168740318 /NCGR_PEP_ID=MMETSP0724-20121128/11920_1 /TAXON_ID=265536 /ORGANISM="Amphiprora sp., Strain CCMP467" /LENGTH=81 /DNA_ID=CAMNT_0008787755 /DNA_START=51 /DNA_END=296 /DNA_ORIENTATION=-